MSNIIYVLATTFLFIGSILSFDKTYTADYFYMLGTTLFLIKSLMSLYEYYRNEHNINNTTNSSYSSYSTI